MYSIDGALGGASVTVDTAGFINNTGCAVFFTDDVDRAHGLAGSTVYASVINVVGHGILLIPQGRVIMILL